MEYEIYNFFKGSKNRDKITLDGILSAPDFDLEFKHRFVQWCFPIHETSKYNLDAPVMSHGEQKLLISDDEVKDNMSKCFKRWLSFFDFEIKDNEIVHIQNPRMNHPWLSEINHNHLRITRIIRSLRLFGLDAMALNFYKAVDKVAKEFGIHPTSRVYWRIALNGELFSPIKLTPETKGIGQV